MYASTIVRKVAKSALFFALALLCSTGFAQKSGIDRIVIFGASLTDSGNETNEEGIQDAAEGEYHWYAGDKRYHCGGCQNADQKCAKVTVLLEVNEPFAEDHHRCDYCGHEKEDHNEPEPPASIHGWVFLLFF